MFVSSTGQGDSDQGVQRPGGEISHDAQHHLSDRLSHYRAGNDVVFYHVKKAINSYWLQTIHVINKQICIFCLKICSRNLVAHFTHLSIINPFIT